MTNPTARLGEPGAEPGPTWTPGEAGVGEGEFSPGLGEPCPGNEKGSRVLATHNKERAGTVGLPGSSELALCFPRVALTSPYSVFVCRPQVSSTFGYQVSWPAANEKGCCSWKQARGPGEVTLKGAAEKLH